jgi:16S rRNA (cytosine967-C5)-methyltransferase
MTSVRAKAAQIIHQVTHKHIPLKLEDSLLSPQDRALLQELVLGTLRYYIKLNAITAALSQNPKSVSGTLLESLIACGLYQLLYTEIPAYAVVNETVNAARELKLGSCTGFINAVLHKVCSEDTDAEKFVLKEHEIFAYPKWLFKRIKKNYPKNYREVLSGGNEKPSMWLRVDLNRISLADYIEMLKKENIDICRTLEPSGICLSKTCPPSMLPGISQGLCYIQDASAQLAVTYMAPKENERILDACAAPGGKTIHIIESTKGNADVTAVDIHPQRLERLRENLKIRGINLTIIQGSAADPDKWWDGKPFDRILLDAPCSGTGVIRRHPDIKFVRKEKDISELIELQMNMLEALWKLLKHGGTLMYTTCSILKEENQIQINNFLYIHRDDAELEEIPESQHLPSDDGRDGFFYAKIRKK